MINSVEKLLQIKVNNISVALFNEVLRMLNRIVLTTSGSKPEAGT